MEQARRALMLIVERIREIGYEDGILTCDDEKVSYLLTMIKAAPLHV